MDSNPDYSRTLCWLLPELQSSLTCLDKQRILLGSLSAFPILSLLPNQAAREVFLNVNLTMSLSCLQIVSLVMEKIRPRLKVVLVQPKKLESKSQKFKLFPGNLIESQNKDKNI